MENREEKAAGLGFLLKNKHIEILFRKTGENSWHWAGGALEDGECARFEASDGFCAVFQKTAWENGDYDSRKKIFRLSGVSGDKWEIRFCGEEKNLKVLEGKLRGMDSDLKLERKAGVLDYIFFASSDHVSSEQAQGMARIAITTVLLIGFSIAAIFSEMEWFPAALCAAYLGLSWVGFRAVSGRAAGKLWPRRLGLAGDLGMVGYGLGHLGLSGLALYPVFLWIVIGYGLRYGKRFLLEATAAGLFVFLAGGVIGEIARNEPGVFLGLLIGLGIMPKLFIEMISQLEEQGRDLRRQRDEAEELALTDRLTGMPNRLFLEEEAARAVRRAKAIGKIGGIVFLDLDGFKGVNDRFGHAKGDALLKMAARAIEKSLATGDSAARFGGDEFVLLIEERESPEDIIKATDAALKGIKSINWEGEKVTASCGVAFFPMDGETFEDLAKKADTAMHKAKIAGKDRWMIYDPDMSKKLEEEAEIEARMREGIERGEFEMFYQPLCKMADGGFAGAEALIRWNHPEKGILGPGYFIPLAEKTGLIVNLGDFALQASAREAAEWVKMGLENFHMHVNVSAKQLELEEFPERVDAALRESGLAAKNLEIEVTESALVGDGVVEGGVFARLLDIGVGLSLDDFGTGYSSLGYLRKLPVGQIKIDQSFVADIPNLQSATALLEATIAFGKRMDMELVAEGIETQEQFEWLKQRGCQIGQGYLIGKPMPSKQIRKIIQRCQGGERLR